MARLPTSVLRRGAAVFAARQQQRFLSGYATATASLPTFTETTSYHGMELTFLGASSQTCPRGNPSSLALRLRTHNLSQMWLFDAGEGALAQLQRSHLRISQLRKIFITHMHPDHVYGLPGIVMSALAGRDSPQQREIAARARESGNTSYLLPPLTVYGPPGIRSFLRASLGATLPMFRETELLRIVELSLPKDVMSNRRLNSVRPFWYTNLRKLPFEVAAAPLMPRVDKGTGSVTYDVVDACKDDPRYTSPVVDDRDREPYVSESRQSIWPANVEAGVICHSVPSIAYVITEDMGGFRFDKEKLASLGLPIDGRRTFQHVFQSLMQGNSVEHDGGIIRASDVSRTARRPRRICICGDTSDASGIEHLAKGVDVLVHEATSRAADTDLARKRGHSSSLTAAAFAKRIDAKRLVLNHTSVAYDVHEVRALEAEARRAFGSSRAFVAHDMSVFNVPTLDRDDEKYPFRSFLGYPRHIEHFAPVSKYDILSAKFGSHLGSDDSCEENSKPTVVATRADGKPKGGLFLTGERPLWLSEKKESTSSSNAAEGDGGNELDAMTNRQQARSKRLHVSEKDLLTPLKAFSNRRRSFAAV